MRKAPGASSNVHRAGDASATGRPSPHASRVVEDGGALSVLGMSSTPPTENASIRRLAWAFTARSTFSSFSRHQCLDLAAALTYYAVLASAPALLALVSLLGLVGEPESTATKVLDSLTAVVPDNAMAFIEPLVTQVTENSEKAGVALVVGLVAALWSASGYVGAFARAMNRIRSVDEGRPVWKLRPILLGITVITIVVAAVVGSLLVLSGPLARTVGEAIGASQGALMIWNIVKWPVVILLVVLLIALLYRWTPNVRATGHRLGIGAVAALGLWVIASAVFGLYVSRLGSYGSTYGTLAGIIVFLLWLWITNTVLLLGAELDVAADRSRQLRAGVEAQTGPVAEPADVRATTKRDRRAQAVAEAGEALRRTASASDAGPTA